jgi:protoporphyrin/coproporphyrin ferrochelatase
MVEMTGAGAVTVFLVGFGGPESLDQVPAFVESVLGRTPPDHVIPAVVSRYQAIGGGSPLPGTTRRQAELLEKELGDRGHHAKVHVGMLHASPTIAATADEIASGDVDDAIVVSLAPYRCEVSTDAYEKAVADALGGRVASVRFAPDWNLSPRYVDALAEMLAATLGEAPPGSPVIFTAHSLPQRMIYQGDPYVRQLEETAGAVSGELGLDHWQLAYQSVSAAAREPWLGPSVEEAMDQLVDSGMSSVVVDPIGFIADHVETLYDNDVEHRAHAESIGIDFYRCRCLNTHPGLISALADVVEGVA